MLDPGVGSTMSVGAGSNSLGDKDLFTLTMNGDDLQSPNQQSHATILEEQDEDNKEVGCQSALLEPDALRIRRFFYAPWMMALVPVITIPVVSSSAAAALYATGSASNRMQQQQSNQAVD